MSLVLHFRLRVGFAISALSRAFCARLPTQIVGLGLMDGRSRRQFLNGTLSGLLGSTISWNASWPGGMALIGTALGPRPAAAQDRTEPAPSNADRLRGLICGGFLGDAIGGPVEFGSGPQVEAVLPRTRSWSPERKCTADERHKLAETLPLLSYETLRPGVESYAQWRAQSPAGTVTDDSRHKIVLLRTLAAALSSGQLPVTRQQLAQQYVDFVPRIGEPMTPSERELCEDGLQEYRYAARWLLGVRDETQARPVERIWAGIDTCSGQMMLLPLAAAYPGRPEAAYRAAYAIDFIDAPGARDFAASLVAALAAVVDPALDMEPIAARWNTFWKALRETDPLRLAQVPFAGRPLHRWLDMAHSLAERADGRPATLFKLLETEGVPVYWWDAHFTLLVPLALLKFCEHDALAAMHLILDFGHDTDSYAQVLGAIAGAVHGESLFPAAMRAAVTERLKIDYQEDPTVWFDTLLRCAAIERQTGKLVEPIA